MNHMSNEVLLLNILSPLPYRSVLMILRSKQETIEKP